MRVCRHQEHCKYYDSGDNKPPNHDVRAHYVCSKYFKNCEGEIWWKQWQGETIACKIKGG